ncbi:DUF6879 family protein [Marinactinospora thermotolerans]|uniref:DUF6879 domain-containing protein n=1 Tax=Marinactinospora thermotolerans DSM 45154 TaxID=1122192 RepID=A0A1T4TBS1_9ACTN|nr:DUF6879 family protein [Marinactinospora thermotolerans]SKA38000.1 hypothetical protein SAMN02745673_04772 [Marinactinospora thermotolerans DSM 45154]
MGLTFTSLEENKFQHLFEEFSYTAYRLETLQTYGVPYELEEFRRFRSGQSRGAFPGISRWIDRVRKGGGQGKVFHRVHVVSEPLSDYVRFECAWSYRHTVRAGEDVRILPVDATGWPDGLPRSDYWLFDSSVLVWMDYAADGAFRSAELVDDPAAVVQANLWRDRAIHLSIPFTQYEQGFDPMFLPR